MRNLCLPAQNKPLTFDDDLADQAKTGTVKTTTMTTNNRKQTNKNTGAKNTAINNGLCTLPLCNILLLLLLKAAPSHHFTPLERFDFSYFSLPSPPVSFPRDSDLGNDSLYKTSL